MVDHPDGRVFFVRGVWPGDVGTYVTTDAAKTYDYAELISIETPSADRVEIPCPHRRDESCGGCPWMMVSYPAQLAAKEQRVTFLLDRNGITPGVRHPIIGSPKIFNYRNRAQFKTDGVQLGYVTEGSNQLAPINECMILNPPMQHMLQGLLTQLPNQSWKPVDGYPWSYLDVDDEQTFAEVIPNKRRPFRQGNSEQNEIIKAWIKKVLADVPKDSPVIEAFCGSGNLTESLSSLGFQDILAAEVRGSAIEELFARDLPGVRITEIDMSGKGVWQQLAKRQSKAKVLLVDPPREGMDKRQGIFEYLPKLETVLYISCEPTTWARDIKDFQTNGWMVTEVIPLDMFPHTPHVEILSVLKKTSGQVKK